LIAHEGHGSILSELKRCRWSTSLNCDHVKYANGFGFFEIKVDLTDGGFEHIDDIVKLIFQYLNLIRNLGIQQWIFDELQSLNEIEFRFEDEKNPVSLVSKVSSCMRHYPFEDILTGPVIIEDFRPDLIRYILGMLNPENLRIIIVDQSFYYRCNRTEYIYGTKYGTERIKSSTIDEWKACGSTQSLNIPAPNVYIPSDFTFHPIDNWKQTYPKIIHENKLVRVWFMQDTEFRKPKTIMTVELKNPTINCDPLNWNLTHLFVWMLEDHLKEKLYGAILGGIDWRIGITTSGLRIYINGFHHKQDIFLENLLNEMFKFKIDLRHFEDTYDAYLADLKGFEGSRPQHIAIYILELIFNEQMWSNEELIAAMKVITFPRLKTFAKEVLTQTFGDCFIYGNVNVEMALKLASIVEDRLNRARTTKMMIVLGQSSVRERRLNDGEEIKGYFVEIFEISSKGYFKFIEGYFDRFFN
jgi:insulysin